MNTAMKEANTKASHPERFCSYGKCLWRVMELNHATKQHEANPKYSGGKCPRHGGKT